MLRTLAIAAIAGWVGCAPCAPASAPVRAVDAGLARVARQALRRFQAAAAVDICVASVRVREGAEAQVRASDPTGLVSLEIDLLALPSGAATVTATPGETWYFQAWHRDVVGGLAASNLTGAIETTLQ